MNRFFKALLVFGITWSALQGQQEDIPCATPGHISDWLLNYQNNPVFTNARNGNEILYLPITIHSVGKNDGTGHYPTLRIFESLCRLNTDFAPYNIQFYLKGAINKINRDIYYDHTDFGEGARMMRTYKKSLTINTFITNQAPSNACGYWHQSEDAIVVIKNCMGGSGHTLTHEVGHWLSLPHTFLGWEGKTYDPAVNTPVFHGINGRDTLYVETVAGNNCSKAGDRFCDTPADYLSLGWNCNGSFQSLQVQKDPQGIDFRSDGSNFMSYSVDACQSKFSQSQSDAMRTFISQVKPSFVNRNIPINKVSAEPMTFVRPQPNEQIHYQSIKLEWNHHPNATHYLINISKFSFFVTIDYEFIVEGNSINIGDLPVDKKWFWRVKPYNPYDACGEFTDAGGFTTFDITDVEEISPGNRLDIYPTLLRQNQELQFDFDISDLINLQAELVSTSGQVLLRRTFSNPGRGLEFWALNLPSGFYLLRLTSSKGSFVRRITIQ